MKKERLITILGPTASGKTDLAVHLAEALGFQIYKHMDIGTAKVTKEEARGIRHFLVDELEPSEPYSAADFQEKARKIIYEENEAGRIPILCGGTGLYIQGLLEGYTFLPRGEGRKKFERRRKERKLWKICFVKRGRKIFLPTRSG